MRAVLLTIVTLAALLVGGCENHSALPTQPSVNPESPVQSSSDATAALDLPTEGTITRVSIRPSDESSREVIVGLPSPRPGRVSMTFTPQTTYQVGEETTTTLEEAIARGPSGIAGDGVVWWASPVGRVTYHTADGTYVLDHMWVPWPH